ncbi:Protein C56C10.4 [Aphelenchoides avenae]|nr:Protein C56C10.4 [Aphelenchus avenae]
MCGGGCGMPPPPPPPPPTCQSTGCPPSYTCGSMGCHQARRVHAKGAKTVKLTGTDKYALLRSVNSPDDDFIECCLDNDLPDACLRKCTYSTYTKDSLRTMFLGFDECPLVAAQMIHHCAARKQNHEKCCRDVGTTDTLAGEKCLVFCNQAPGNVTRLDFSYLPCFDKFDEMRGCFWHSAVKDMRVNLESIVR